MKKTISIVLVTLILMNAMGYYAVFLGLQYKNDAFMTHRLDASDFEAAHTITIKVPITIPYRNGSDDFERINGNFSHRGESYRLVKQKYNADTLTIICVRDFENEKIEEALTQYLQAFTDSPNDSRQNNSKLTVSFIKDYITQPFGLTNTCPGWQADVIRNGFDSNLISSFTTSILHPPEFHLTQKSVCFSKSRMA